MNCHYRDHWCKPMFRCGYSVFRWGVFRTVPLLCGFDNVTQVTNWLHAQTSYTISWNIHTKTSVRTGGDTDELSLTDEFVKYQALALYLFICFTAIVLLVTVVNCVNCLCHGRKDLLRVYPCFLFNTWLRLWSLTEKANVHNFSILHT